MTTPAISVLAADVGGTNTRIALCNGTHVAEETVRRFPNDEFGSLSEVLRCYRSELTAPVEAACVAVAGPVRAGVGRLTNRDWEMTGPELRAATGATSGYVINDLEAQGHALDHVTGQPILGDAPSGHGTRLVVGVGTGFNAAPVHGTASGAHVAASEAGHVSLPVWNDDSLSLANGMIRDVGFASVEEALSGRGLLRLRAHYARDSRTPSGTEVLATANASPDSPEARAANMMAELLGRVVGDLALIHLPTGGIFLVGGMSRALQPWISGPSFARGYLDKGRFSKFLETFAVALVEDDYAALTGCAGFVARQR